MGLVCKVVEKDEKLTDNSLTLGFPDESGQLITLVGIPQADIDSVEERESYTISFTPYTAPASTPAPAPAAPAQAASAPVDPSAAPAASQGDASGI